MFSVCIPRVFKNIQNSKIVSIFETLKLGEVAYIDSVDRDSRISNKPSCKMVFVYFNKWFDTAAANNLRKKIEDPTSEAKLIYSDPWYWILLPNDSNDKLNIENKINELAIAKAKNDLHVKIQSEMNNKIDTLQDEISRIYEELYKREYHPSVEEDTIPLWDNDTYGTHSTMSISEFTPLVNIPSTLSYATIHPEEEIYYDESLDLNSDCSNDYSNDRSNDRRSNDLDNNCNDLLETKKNDKFPEITFKDRLWVTTNLCDNL
tara:strand:+ start:1863 stop:2648 length:786 start_codon:yes stop_codon:yes gene_type:complete